MNAWYNEDVDFQGVLGAQALYPPTSMAKAKLVDKEYPKLGQKVSKRSVFLSTSPHGS